MVKLAKEIDEPDKLQIKGESVDEDEKNTVTRCRTPRSA